MSSRYRQQFDPSKIHLGLPLEFDLFDRHANLLLRKGAVIESEQIIESLMRSGAYFYTGPNLTRYQPPTSDSEASSYHQICSLLAELEGIYLQLDHPPQQQLFSSAIESLVDKLQDACARNPSALLGTTQLIIHGPGALLHALHCALICEIAGSRLDWDDKARKPLIAAALTQNVGLWGVLGTLEKQNTPLTGSQQALVKEHPKRSVETLHKYGVRNRRWLQAVLQSHERLDGSGYPRGLAEEQIIPEARLLSIVDSYVAMTRPRAYRETFRSQYAMKELFKLRGQTIDTELSELLLSVMGLFPPGCLVRLLSGEAAIVLENRNEKTVHLSVISDKQTHPLETPAAAIEVQITEISGVLNLIDYEKLVAHLGVVPF